MSLIIMSTEQTLIEKLKVEASISDSPEGDTPKAVKPKGTPKSRPAKQADPKIKETDAYEETQKVPKVNQKSRVSKAKKDDISGENGDAIDADAEQAVEPTTPKTIPVGKRAASAKVGSPVGDNGTPTAPRSKKRGTAEEIGEGNDTTPSKKSRVPAVTPRTAREKLPTSMAELSPQDRLMFQMRDQGNTWVEITEAYSKITGLTYGKSSIANRYAKIVASLHEWKEGDIERMLYSYDIIEQETKANIAALIKKAETEIWSKTASYMETYGSDKYSGSAVEKAYQKEKRTGFPHRETIPAVMALLNAANGLGHDANAEGEDEVLEDDEAMEEDGEEFTDAPEM